MVAIYLHCLAIGGQTAFDEQYVVKYDPDQDGEDPEGNPMNCLLVTSLTSSMARRFTDVREAFAYIQQVPSREPIRPDGLPNKPLTAFTLEILPI